MMLDERCEKICAVGVAEEDDPVRVELVTGHGAFDERRERFGFATDVRLIERLRIEAAELEFSAEPAIGTI